MDDFKREYNRYWARYHMVARYMACPDIPIEKQAGATKKLNDAELQLGDLIQTAKEHIGRELTPNEIEFGFFTGWNLDV